MEPVPEQDVLRRPPDIAPAVVRRAMSPASGASTLRVGSVDDPAERDADRIADEVIRRLAAPASTGVRSAHRDGGRIRRSAQRDPSAATSTASTQGGVDPDEIDLDDLDQEGALSPDEHEPLVASSPEPTSEVRRRVAPSMVRRRAMRSTEPDPGSSEPIGEQGGSLDDQLSSRIQSARGSGRPLDGPVRRQMERAFGHDLSHVRTHADGAANELSRQLSATAFTTGHDIFFGGDAPDASTADGQHLLAHELAHVEQQRGEPVARKADPEAGLVHRRFKAASTVSNAHLRELDAWGTMKGPKIKARSTVLVNDAAPRVQEKRTGNATWYPAVIAGPEDFGSPIPDDHRGYIRSSRVRTGNEIATARLQALIRDVLIETEEVHPMVGGQLAKQAHVDFLCNEALQLSKWDTDVATATDFAPGFAAATKKIGRIREGAEFLASSVDHWLDWLHPDGKSIVWDLKLMESDLHEHGLGVAMVEFRKSPGPPGHKFANDTKVVAMLKPENKALEQALLGDDPTSAVSQINARVGLTGDDEMLTKIRMEATEQYGTLVECAKGLRADKMPTGPHDVDAVFHETLVFAFLAGLDDLHDENVFWHEGRPYLIDADNALIRNQMHKEASGDIDQSGFTAFNLDEATKNRTAVRTGDNSEINSKILDAMLNDSAKRIDIAKILRNAIAGKKGRVVPLSSKFWGKQREYWQSQEKYRDQNLTTSSSEAIIVGKAGKFDSAIGAGLIGVSGENTPNRMYNQQKEKEQQRVDFERGVIPFYDYSFTDGKVTHNGEHIWNGQTVDQAIGALLDRFDPSGLSRQNAGL